MGVKFVVTPEYQIAVIMRRHAPIAEKHPPLKCLTVEYRVDGVFYLKFGQAVAGVGVTAERAVESAVLTIGRLGHLPWAPADVSPLLGIWVKKMALAAEAEGR